MINVQSNVYKGAYNARWQGNKSTKKAIDVDASIIEMRKIYSDMTDIQFVNWYCSKYPVHPDSVIRVVETYNKEEK